MNKNETKLTELTKNDKINPEISAIAEIETFFQIDGATEMHLRQMDRKSFLDFKTRSFLKTNKIYLSYKLETKVRFQFPR